MLPKNKFGVAGAIVALVLRKPLQIDGQNEN